MPRSRAVRAAAVVAAILIAGIGWYLGSPLFIRTTASEALPTAAAAAATSSATTPPLGATPAAAASPTGPTTSVLRRGQLQYVDALHNGKGAVLIVAVSSCCPVSDQYFLRFDDVAITNAPDVHVYLSKDKGGKWSEATSKYLGPLKATNGSFNYPVAPSDGGEYASVVVWCRAFSVLVTWADLGSA